MDFSFSRHFATSRLIDSKIAIVKQVGGVQVSTLHANYFVNLGNGTATDVLKLIDQVRKTVAKKTGVELGLEVKIVG